MIVAWLPAGIRLKKLTLKLNRDVSMADLLRPSQESTRARVQATLGSLETLEIRYTHYDQKVIALSALLAL